MTVVERQVHGYRQGHQLLAASAQLPKADQSVIDQLSDVAGPLRPRERFASYLSAYPLPSGERYVLARTWQDLTVARAGCVRTLSLIIPIADWGAAQSLSSFLGLLEADQLPQESDAARETVPSSPATPLPPAPDFRASELLEAMFLEEARPVAVFDAPRPDLLAHRLLTAMWPSMRRRFALSTFALSPRKVGGRDFDLIFAPKDARAKFADWNGRRVDGRSSQSARHRWTGAIVSRVFEQPYPQLLTSREVGLVGGGDDVDEAGALRIALFWDELFEKLETTPTAALGLLDIANSGKVHDSLAIRSLEPALVDAVRRASFDLPVNEAWDFLGAITRKMQGRSMAHGKGAVDDAAERLAGRAPEQAVAFLAQPDLRGIGAELLPRIAGGIGDAFTERAERALLSAEPEVLCRLVAEGGTLIGRVAGDASLINRLGNVLSQLNPSLVDAVSAELLPRLVEDWQLPAARPLLMRLDGQALAEEVRHLGTTNDFAASRLAELVVERARKIGARVVVRSALAELPPSEHRDGVLAWTLDASPDDAAWLLHESQLPDDAASGLLVGLLREADDHQLFAIVSDARVSAEVMCTLERSAADLLPRVVFADDIPLDAFVSVVRTVLPKADENTKARIADRALHRCLSSHFAGDELGFLATILGIVGERLDGAWVARMGLDRSVRASVASRNMVAFRKAPQPARLKVVWSIAEVAEVLSNRRSFDLDAAAAESCAQMMFEAEKVTPAGLLNAAGHLLPMLMRQRKDPVSPMIAASFPVIYRELAKEDDVPDLLKFVPFFDWDRCKAARQELVSAFMSSTWPPSDLALTACRCADVGKILRRTAKSYGGDTYIDRIADDVMRLPDACRKPIEQTISTIRSDRYAKYNWRD